MRPSIWLLAAALGCAHSFVATPDWRARTLRNAENSDEEKRPAKITLEGLRDLVALGLGAPNLGTFKGVDKDTGAMKFELDENRFITKDGK